MACQNPANKCCSSHLFWCGPKLGCSDSVCARIIESHNFFVLGPILVKFHIRTCLIKSFSTMYGFCNSGEEKLQFTPFWLWSLAGLLRQRSYRNYRKPKLFCLTFYLGEISHSNSANWELSNNVSLLEVLPRKVALHTSSHLTQIEGWRSAVSTTSEGRRVSSEVRLENWTQVWGLDKIWTACDSRLRKNSTSHQFWLVQTCPDLRRTMQWPCTLVSHCQFFALSNALILQSYVLSWWNCIF